MDLTKKKKKKQKKLLKKLPKVIKKICQKPLKTTQISETFPRDMLLRCP